jgi:hypothetical protein
VEPFRLDQAPARGLTRDMLRTARYRRLGHGIYTETDRPVELGDQVAAARLVLPADAVVTGVTALHLQGVTLGDPLPVRASTATSTMTRRAELRLSRVNTLPAAQAGTALPAAAWVGACAELDLVSAVAAGDWLLRLRRGTAADLHAAAEAATGRGCRRARAAAALVRERVDSVRETRLRLMLVLAGLPEPRANVTLGTADGPIGRVDLVLDAFRLILEYDGDQHRDRQQWNTDLDRDDAFRGLGYLTLRVTADRMRRPRALVLRVHAALVERGYRGPAPVFSPLWCALFER